MLITMNLEEKVHIGVLTGAEITDIKITLIAGKAHNKHTEGGDFREATYRAVRQGLKMGESVLLEPYYIFRLEVPMDMIGRAMSDVQRMYGRFEPPEINEKTAILKGMAPVQTMNGYLKDVMSYSKGLGKLSCTIAGYDICHNEDEIIERINYQSEMDIENPTSSVFCAHGAGYLVAWDRVPEYVHIQTPIKLDKKDESADEEKSIILERQYKNSNYNNTANSEFISD